MRRHHYTLSSIMFKLTEWQILILGAKKHFLSKHSRNITREEIVKYTRTRNFERDTPRLEILESLIIRFEDPEINKQDTGKRRKLRLFGTTVLTTSPQE